MPDQLSTIDHLSKLDPHLVDLLSYIETYFPFKIICSYRSDIDQDLAFQHHKTTKRGGQSKHNLVPSMAVDVISLSAHNRHSFDSVAQICQAYFAGAMRFAAMYLGFRLIWGCDWNSDSNISDHNLWDWCHFEFDSLIDSPSNLSTS